MKKLFLTVLVALLLLGIATAINSDATKWSIRGNVDESNVVTINGLAILDAWGSAAAYANLQGSQTQGSVMLTAMTSTGVARHSFSWDSKRQDDGTTFVIDDGTVTQFTSSAREVFWQRGSLPTVTEGVPILVTYRNDTKTLDIVSAGFSYVNIDVVNLIG